jgi:hypothetical protein
MDNVEKSLIAALEDEARKYMDCGLLDEAADIAAVVELIQSGAAPWCPVNFDLSVGTDGMPTTMAA